MMAYFYMQNNHVDKRLTYVNIQHMLTCYIIMSTCEMITGMFTYDLNSVACQHSHVPRCHK